MNESVSPFPPIAIEGLPAPILSTAGNFRSWFEQLRLHLCATVRKLASESAASLSGATLVRRFNELIASHGALISRICFSYATDGEDYKDLRQDVMLNIWKGLSTFREDSAAVTWVYRVAFNTCVSTVRKRSRSPYTERLDSMPIDLPEISEDEGIRERLKTLYKLISELSPIDKAIVTMWLDSRNYDEIASVVGVSRANISLRMHRIKERWRSKVENFNIE